MALLLGGLLGHFISRVDHIFNPRPFYSESLGALEVLQSGMNWVETTNGPRLYITGIVTNRSDISWHELEFECRFFDRNGAMVDAAHPRGGLTLLPRYDSAFRATVVPVRSQPDYQRMTISIANARNARSRW